MKLFDKIALGISCALTLAIICNGTAYPADISTKAPVVAPAAAPAINWNGAYIGGFLGYAFKNEDTAISGNDAFSRSILSTGAFPNTIGLRPDGGVIGARIGYDFQFGRIVAGVLGAYSYSGMKGNAYAGGNLAGVSYSETIKDIWDIHGRVGYLMTDRALLYFVGGFTGAKVNTTVSSAGLICTTSFITCPAGASSATDWGYSIGGGLEYRLDRNWSLSAEYLWTDLGTQNTTVAASSKFGCGPKGNSPCTTSWNNAERVEFSRVLVGINFRF